MPGISPDGASARPVRIRLLALPETTPATLLALQEVFGAVGRAWTELTGEPPAAAPMDVAIVARTPLVLPPPAAVLPLGPAAQIRPDVAIVTDLALGGLDRLRGRWPEEAAWLRAAFAEGAIAASVCTGTALLAEAGLLDGQTATTHWAAAELLRQEYPAVRLRPDLVLARSGPEDRLVTAGGVAAWEDLVLYLVARLAGRTEAVRIARVFLFGDRSQGQLPFAMPAPPRRHADAAIARSQQWLAEHYDEPHPVGRMAGIAGLSRRSFTRRFRAATGLSPVDYLQNLRIEEAKQILETGAEPVEVVAALVGYEDPAAFRRLFRRRTGTTPAQHRRRFARIGQPPG
jgi:transcriptional regulator GlxA family with amidase domain